MAQLSGSEFEFWYLVESTQGVFNFPNAVTPANTTLTADFDPTTDTTITVASDTNITAGDVLIIGDQQNQEIFIVDAGYVSGTTVDMDPLGRMFFRHRSGEAVVEKDPTAGGAWRKLTGATSVALNGDIPIVPSQALTGEPLLSSFRQGNIAVDPSINAEMSYRNSGLFLAGSMNNDYATVGTATAGASTTTDAAAAIGDTIVSVTSEVGFAVGEFAQLGSGSTAEVFKIGAVSAGQLDLDTIEHPRGLRKAHASSTVCDEVISPFTHTLTSGSLPPGITLLAKNATENIFFVVRAMMNSTMDVTHNADDTLGNITSAWVAKSVQVIETDIFGTPDERAHLPLSHYEKDVLVDGSVISTNLWRTLTTNKANNTSGAFVCGSQFRGAIAPGANRSYTGSFTYQYNDTTFNTKTLLQTETPIVLQYNSIQNPGFQLEFNMPKTILGGNPAVDVNSGDPIETTQTFSTRKDTGGLETDVQVTVTNDEVTLI